MVQMFSLAPKKIQKQNSCQKFTVFLLLKRTDWIFSACQQLINMDFSPSHPQQSCMLGCGQTKQGMGNYMSGVDGWLGGAEMECLIQGTPARGGFSLASPVASVQRRRHLASWNATGRGGGRVREAESLLCQSGGGL